MRVNTSIIIARPATPEVFQAWADTVEQAIDAHNAREERFPSLNGDRRAAILETLRAAVGNSVRHYNVPVTITRGAIYA